MKNNNLIFFQAISLIKIELSNNATIFKSIIINLNVFTFLKIVQIFFRRRSNLKKNNFFIYNVDAEFFDLLIK